MTKTVQAALRARRFAGFLALAYRSQARDGMRLLWRAPMRTQGQGWGAINPMDKISERIIVHSMAPLGLHVLTNGTNVLDSIPNTISRKLVASSSSRTVVGMPPDRIPQDE